MLFAYRGALAGERTCLYYNTHWTSLVFLGDLPVVSEISQPLCWKPIKNPLKLVNIMVLSHPQTLLHPLHLSESISCQTSDQGHPCFSSANTTWTLFHVGGHGPCALQASPAGPSCPAESARTRVMAAAQKFKLLLQQKL